MSAWILATLALTLCLVPCGAVCLLRKDAVDRLVGLEMATLVETLLLVCLAEALGRPSFYELALTLAVLSFGGGLVFTRFLERWV